MTIITPSLLITVSLISGSHAFQQPIQHTTRSLNGHNDCQRKAHHVPRSQSQLRSSSSLSPLDSSEQTNESASFSVDSQHGEINIDEVDEMVLKVQASEVAGDAQSTSTTISNEQAKKEKAAINIAQVTSSVMLMLTACIALIIASGPGAWRYFLCGGICAAFSHALTTPLDVIKTRKQVDDSLNDFGFFQSGIKLMKDEGGPGALLAGLGPTTFGYLFEGSVKFGVYEVLKPMVKLILTWTALRFSIPQVDSKVLGFLISGGLAGAAASIMLCPMEALRIRLVADPDFAAKGWVQGGLKMIKGEGVKGLWKSMPAMLFKQVPYTVTKNVSFDLITTLFYAIALNQGRTICKGTKIVIPLVAAMLASVLSCISSQPGDMLLSVVNAHKGKRRTHQFAREIMAQDGIGGFFVGLNERFVHVGMIVTLQLMTYDFVKRLVGISATGL